MGMKSSFAFCVFAFLHHLYVFGVAEMPVHTNEEPVCEYKQAVCESEEALELIQGPPFCFLLLRGG